MKKLYSYILKKWFQLPQPVRFILVGGWNTCVAYGLYVLILWIMDSKHPQIALFASFILSTVQGYLTQKIFVFHTKGNYVKEYVKCLGTWGICYLFNAFLLGVFLYFKFNPYIGQLFSCLIISVNSYLMLKYIAFRNH